VDALPEGKEGKEDNGAISDNEENKLQTDDFE
jgi:hypothetical protein